MANQNKLSLSDGLGEIMIDLDGICRFCLTETQDGISVNDECLYEGSKGLRQESVYGFMTKLRIIEMTKLENFPSKICGNCYELVELFYNFSQVCQKSDSLLKEYFVNTLKETKMGLIFKDDSVNKVDTSVKEPNVLGDKTPQTIGDKVECYDFLNSSQKFFKEYKEKLKALSERIKENHLKLIKNIHIQFIENESTNLIHTCSQCSLRFNSSRALNFHYAAKHSERRFKVMLKYECKICKKTFRDLKRVKRHYSASHRISESELTEAYLNSGVKQLVHIEKINFFCFYCNPHKQLQTQKQLIKHLEECHSMKQTKGGPTLYSCAHCTYATFVTSLSLNQHMLLVHKLREDETTWNEVECVSVAQKSHSGAKPSKASLNSPLLVCNPPGKIMNPPFPDALHLPINSLQDKHSEVLRPEFGPVNDSLTMGSLLGEKKLEQNGPGGSSTKAWNCSECPASYSRKQSLDCHMREKHKRVSSGATKCPECSESFLTNRRLIQHGISVHQKYFAWAHHVFRKVLQPAKEEHREKNFECDTCCRKYIYKTSLRKHILAAHLGKTPKDAVSCTYCGKILSNKLNLKSHIEFVHEALFVSCPICEKNINFRTIGRHYKTHRTNADGVFPGSSFLCNLCGKVLKSKRSFEDHQKLHQNIRDEICDVCGSGFTTKKLLRLHRKTHEGAARRVFACDQCEKVFSGRHTLNRHLLTHSGKKNFICEICSKCFYTIQELNRHVRYHKKDYKFDCQLCDMRFLCKSRFRHHLMKHRNIRPHKCQFCDKMFIERAKMNIHMTAKHNVVVHNTKTVWKDPKTYVPLNDLL